MIVNVPGFEPLKLVPSETASCQGCHLEADRLGAGCLDVPCFDDDPDGLGAWGIVVPADE